MTNQLDDDLRAAFPDEREALRALAHATQILINNLRLGDEPIIEKIPLLPENPTRRERRQWEKDIAQWAERNTNPRPTLGWKNELSVSSVAELENKWLPLAKERLGL